LVRCSRRTSDNQGLEGVARAGLGERGQIFSKEEVKMEHPLRYSHQKRIVRVREEKMTQQRKDGREKVSTGYV